MNNLIDIHAFVESLIKALEARDMYTGNHSDRVARLSEATAVQMQFGTEKSELIHILGHVHDIGKIGIADGILFKTGKLTKAEFAVIQDHCEIGYNILKTIPFFDQYAEVVLYHHERIDGKGYPRGLKGAEIPLESCIITVADAFDAITTTRTYRSSRDLDTALQIISADRGTHFNSQVVDAFLKVDRNFLRELIREDRHKQE